MTYRGAITMLHGLLFGAFFLFAAFAMLLEVARLYHSRQVVVMTQLGRRLEGAYLVITASCGWLAVFTGTYLIYPWYRATPPLGANLREYPRSLLLANAATVPLHTLGMEWKEHVAFIAPICFTAIAWVVLRYPVQARRPEMRRTLLAFGIMAFLTAAIPGAVGALLNKTAPVEGPHFGNSPHTGRP